jgi:patatin-like phospholipase/acyl hydrolase
MIMNNFIPELYGKMLTDKLKHKIQCCSCDIVWNSKHEGGKISTAEYSDVSIVALMELGKFNLKSMLKSKFLRQKSNISKTHKNISVNLNIMQFFMLVLTLSKT